MKTAVPVPAGTSGKPCRHGPAWASAVWLLASGSVSALDLLPYSDFGQPDILLTAAAIRQTGYSQIARIDQTSDTSGTDIALYPLGRGNIAFIDQEGASNQAYATQVGDLNRLRIVQSGEFNMATTSQTGVGNSLDVLQTGSGNLLVASQNGVGNLMTVSQGGGNLANLVELGNFNTVNVVQSMGSAPVTVNINGSGLTVKISQ